MKCLLVASCIVHHVVYFEKAKVCITLSTQLELCEHLISFVSRCAPFNDFGKIQKRLILAFPRNEQAAYAAKFH